MNSSEPLNVSAIYDDGSLKLKCSGEILIDRIDKEHHTAYVTVRFLSEGGLSLVGFGRIFYYGEEGFSKEKIFQRALDKINSSELTAKKSFPTYKFKKNEKAIKNQKSKIKNSNRLPRLELRRLDDES